MEVISKRHSLRTSQLNNQPEVNPSHRKSSADKPSKLNSSHMVATSTPRSNRCETSVSKPWSIATSDVTPIKNVIISVTIWPCQQQTSQRYDSEVTISIKCKTDKYKNKYINNCKSFAMNLVSKWDPRSRDQTGSCDWLLRWKGNSIYYSRDGMYECKRKKVKYYTYTRLIPVWVSFSLCMVFSELSTRRWESILKTTGMVMGEFRHLIAKGH